MTPVGAGVLAVVSLAGGVALLVVGGKRGARARGVDRVRVPARLLAQAWTPVGQTVVVEYPAPDGTPLRATMIVAFVRAPGHSYMFDGTVWVNRDDPSDVTPRAWGTPTRSLVVMILGAVLLLGAIGFGITAGALALVQSLPT